MCSPELKFSRAVDFAAVIGLNSASRKHFTKRYLPQVFLSSSLWGGGVVDFIPQYLFTASGMTHVHEHTPLYNWKNVVLYEKKRGMSVIRQQFLHFCIAFYIPGSWKNIFIALREAHGELAHVSISGSRSPSSGFGLRQRSSFQDWFDLSSPCGVPVPPRTVMTHCFSSCASLVHTLTYSQRL